MGEDGGSAVRVDLTGDLRVAVGDAAVPARAFPGRQGRLTFAYLAANPRPVPRAELADALWPGGPPRNWRRDLSWLISRLRTLLTAAGLDGAAALPGAGGCYELRLPAAAEVDVRIAATEAETATRRIADRDADGALAAALTAAEIARRPFLPGEDGEWIGAQRRALQRHLLAALDVAATVLADRGEMGRARTLAAEAVDVAPFRENGYTQLIRLQLAAGDRAEALRTYHHCRKLLADELGVEPGPEMQAAYLDALRAGVRPYDTAPETASTYEAPPGNLPLATDRFVGRERDLETVASGLAAARLVTLTGVGGVGKSRLALEAASRLALAYPDGAWQCELSPVAAGRDVAHALASALGVGQHEGRSTDESVLEYLREKRLLLILDNCEHVLDAISPLLAELLCHCPLVAVLATSRERLAVSGEQVIVVEPLTVPVPGADVLTPTTRAAAVELFCVRAAAARAGFVLTHANAAVVAEICRRLDGVPLAIELAAARVATLGLRDIVARLNERFWLLRGGSRPGPARSQTLRATVDWSYDLLAAVQQRVFQRLTVFAGRFSLEAAEAMCNDEELPGADVADAVLALADKSMLVVETSGEQTRYRLLETLREYGRRRLAESGAAVTALRRHAGYFVHEAERAAQGLLGPEEARSVAALHAAFDDLRAAHRWCLEHREADLAVRLVAALHWYTHWRRRAEVYVWAEDTLPLAASHPGFPAVCATAGGGAWQRGDRPRAGELSKLGVAAAGADPLRRLPLHILADVPILEGRLDEAAELYEQALAAAREAGDDYHAALMLANIAMTFGYRGDRRRAAKAAAAAHEQARICSNPTALAWALYVSGEIQLQDNPRRALGLLEESIKLARAVDNRFVLGVALVSAASLRTRHGDPREAVPLFLEVIPLWQRAGNWAQQWTTLRNVVDLFVRLRRNLPAAVLIGSAKAATTAAPVYGPDAERLTQTEQALSSRLGPERFAAAIAEGATMPPETVIRLALAELADVA